MTEIAAPIMSSPATIWHQSKSYRKDIPRSWLLEHTPRVSPLHNPVLKLFAHELPLQRLRHSRASGEEEHDKDKR